jgi:CDP-paratose 2-epimerase
MKPKMLITGGAGFIGSNAALYFARRGWSIRVLDDFSRPGSEENAVALARDVPIEIYRGDIRRPEDLQTAMDGFTPEAVLHLAAQVAVTTSVEDPRTDFEINALGTFNVLEAVRRLAPRARFLFASTNKVYGGLEGRRVELSNGRYRFAGGLAGISEEEALDFHSPYGCSKGAADQYVRDYGRIYGLRTCVVRQSCIYGTRQYGIEDQGWIAWFVIAALLDRPITVYGDGRQVRDVLWVDDLLDLYARCLEGPGTAQIYNAGGGAERSVSVLEVLELLDDQLGRIVPRSFADWRPGDQKIFVSDNSKAGRELGWQPVVPPQAGMRRLIDWTADHLDEIRGFHPGSPVTAAAANGD